MNPRAAYFGTKPTEVTWINVKQRGAVGDGSTDDTAALQAAIDAVGAGGVLYVPSGTYKTTTALNLRDKIAIRGDGDGVSVINQTSTSAGVFAGTDVDRVELADLKLQGPGSGTGTGLRLELGSNPHVEYLDLCRVTVAGFGVDGIDVENPIVSRLSRVTAQSNGRYGINLHGQPGGAAGTSTVLEACYGNANATAGYRLLNMAYSALVGCAADNNGIGYLIDSCFAVTGNGCGGESNTTNAVKVVGGYGVGWRSLFVYDNKGVAVLVTGNAAAVVIEQAIDVEPNATATNFIKTDAGCRAALVACNNTTANSLAAGTTSTLTDAAGNLSVAGTIAAAGTTFTLGGDGVLERSSAFTLRAQNNLHVGSTLQHNGANLGFYGGGPTTQPTVTGSRGGNAALASVLTGLAAMGLVTDSTTA